MARNSEKAMTALARWRQAKLQEEAGFSSSPSSEAYKERVEKRPHLASECLDLKDAEKWRIQVIREVSKKVSQIQNAGLGEFKIRDLNDNINKLLREKSHWEWRIIELGGKDHRKKSRMLDKEGKEVPGSAGYKYFGAARDLPGVRELFDSEVPPPPKKSRAELMKDIDAAYYGFRDDDDGLLVPLEVEAESIAVHEAVMAWKLNEKNSGDDSFEFPPPMNEMDKLEEAMTEGKEARFAAHVPIPSQKDIQNALLQRKKRELLALLSIPDDEDNDDQETKDVKTPN